VSEGKLGRGLIYIWHRAPKDLNPVLNAEHRNTAVTSPTLADLRKKYNTVLIACGMPAARRWLPQALRFFATFFVEWKTLAVRSVALWNP